MSLETRDAEIAQIFASLKIVEVGYPPHLLECRRLEFRQQVAEICLGLGFPILFNPPLKSKAEGGASHTC